MPKNKTKPPITIRQKENSFTIVYNSALRDCSISFQAKGLYSYLKSLPDNWVIYKAEIYKHGTEGRYSMDTAWKELLLQGYMTEKSQRDEKGRFAGWEYTINNKPTKTTPNISNNSNPPKAGFPRSGNPRSGNPHLLNTDGVSTDVISTDGVNLLVNKLREVPKEELPGDSINEFNIGENTVAPKVLKNLETIKKAVAAGGWGHRVSTTTPTALLRQVDTALNCIQYGTYFQGQEWDPKWIERQGIPKAFLLPLPGELLCSTIVAAATKWGEMKKRPGCPDWVKKYSLLTWLYNERSQKSMFLDCYYNNPQNVQEHASKGSVHQIQEKLPLSIKDAAKGLLRSNGRVLEDRAHYAYWRAIQTMHEYWESNYDGISRANQNCGAYKTTYQKLSLLLVQYSKYLTTWNDWNVNSICPGKYIWKQFEQHMLDLIGMSLTPAKKQKKVVKKQPKLITSQIKSDERVHYEVLLREIEMERLDLSYNAVRLMAAQQVIDGREAVPALK